MRRTERALIWPLILGSSSAATAHHSFRCRLTRAVEPRRTASKEKHRADVGPYVRADYTSVLLAPSIRSVRYNLFTHPPRELFELYGLLGFLSALANVHRSLLRLPIADDKKIRHLLPGILPDLLLHAHRGVVDFDPKTLRLQLLLD